MTLNISAIDPSMTSTGLANVKITDTGTLWSTALVKSASDGDAYAALNARFNRLVDRVIWQMTDWELPDLIVMEGPSLHSIGRQHTMAGFWWKAFEALSSVGPVLVVPPNNRIMYATGKGNSGKDVVMLEASRRYPTAPITNNDDADAVVLAAIGARVMNCPVDTLPKTHLRALDKISIGSLVSAK